MTRLNPFAPETIAAFAALVEEQEGDTSEAIDMAIEGHIGPAAAMLADLLDGLVSNADEDGYLDGDALAIYRDDKAGFLACADAGLITFDDVGGLDSPMWRVAFAVL